MSAINFSKFFFGSLPEFFWAFDYGKVDGKGTLERYLSAFSDESSELTVPVQSMSSLIDPDLVPEKFLSLMGAIYGFPPNIVPDSDLYRLVLKNAINIYKHRGTIEGIKRFFEVLNVVIILELTQGGQVNYDDGKTYDQDPPLNFDTNTSYCTGYKITIDDPDDVFDGLGANPAPQYLLDTIHRAFEFLLPIGSTITEIEYNTAVVVEPPPVAS
jgi:phage tail-like protein